MITKNRKVCGYGVNDAEFSIGSGVRDGPKIPSYTSWKSMLTRCYSEKTHQRKPSYKDCSVCPEWLYYTEFHYWYNNQYKEKGWHLDKDILSVGNKVYCPQYCLYIPSEINRFIGDNLASRGNYKIGVVFSKRHNRFIAQCNDPFKKQYVTLGIFDSEDEAHLAWKSYKHSLALRYADSVKDERLASALASRYV